LFAVVILAGRKSGSRRPAKIMRTGFALSTLGLALIIPILPAGEAIASRLDALDAERDRAAERVGADHRARKPRRPASRAKPKHEGVPASLPDVQRRPSGGGR
jgi:hypothetical protein